jgi:hypothetical protein
MTETETWKHVTVKRSRTANKCKYVSNFPQNFQHLSKHRTLLKNTNK